MAEHASPQETHQAAVRSSEASSSSTAIPKAAKETHPPRATPAERRRAREEARLAKRGLDANSIDQPDSQVDNDSDPAESLAAKVGAISLEGVAGGSDVPGTDGGPVITATSQESRFHTESIVTASKEIDLKDVCLYVEQRQLLVDAHLRIKAGVHYGLIGLNGQGKSTLFKALADNLIPGLPSNVRILLVSQLESENVVLKARQAKIEAEDSALPSVLEVVLRSDARRLQFESESEDITAVLDKGDLDGIKRVLSAIEFSRACAALEEAQRIAIKRSGARGADARKALIAAERLHEERKLANENHANLATSARDWLADATVLQDELHQALEEMEASTALSRAMSILHGLGFSDSQISGPFTALSGGWRSRVSLASALLKSTDVLLLDEPVNFLDLPSLLWLEGFIAQCSSAVITVAHDREFLDAVSDELIVLRKERLTYFDGNLTEYERETRRAFKLASKQQDVLDKKRQVVEKSISEATRIARKTGDEKKQKSAAIRQRKLDERWGLEVNAKGHRFKLNRDFGGYHLTARGGPEIDTPDKEVMWKFEDPEPLRFPGSLAHLDHADCRHAKRSVLRDVNLTIEPGDRVALVGPNGHGKTTLVNVLLGRLAPAAGTSTHHSRLRWGLYAQHTVASLSTESRTALQYLLDLAASRAEGQARGLLGRMGLPGRFADTMPVKALSGGQKVRCGLLATMWDAPDLVVLDEVTTHLDSDSIDALIKALKRYTGAILLVSHDRMAVKRIVEGAPSPISSTSADEDEVSSSEDEDEEEHGVIGRGSTHRGRVYLVENGSCDLLEGGMDEYVRRVERRAR
ncbi:P-loop containing nucleoside triphosphate hydrolase protein [Ceraceosorus guamensis]|uniref:P-loop containing nucleoside triphosphate hydrolase protein n=1 Tax=Ceraceosorus guamensis TaxID=1522189 RepID=A0A316VZ31_9BASI|nr:P-loop containing nucleoside triphosphate hydrolase protein [Ceraceosorus guamensis]PWN41511.1 P-loop containing nucleoside triphosphate hydrolase protein [Ceraceosorus guamensis]